MEVIVLIKQFLFCHGYGSSVSGAGLKDWVRRGTAGAVGVVCNSEETDRHGNRSHTSNSRNVVQSRQVAPGSDGDVSKSEMK
ncbi:hypothetical protein Nepgr_016007 [Nepenthes gracilis]|uniref:Uncharacterized protein n=1 Tax=Nepenthes gracilis TaxID=150966 RepID=A0AAD3SPP3_NEPGR|nr:hypothetical protein Nepgr_016007 [Nepenthes gracilis]